MAVDIRLAESKGLNMQQLFHIYIGTKYHGPVRANNKHQAVRLYAERVQMSPFIFHAREAIDPRSLKMPESQRVAQ